MKQKTFILLLAFILCGSFPLLAQNNKTSNANEKQRETTFVEGNLNNLKAAVQLAPTQESEIRELLKTLYQNRENIKKQETKSNKEKIGAKKPIHDAYIQQLNAILTEEQRLQLNQKSEERKNAGIQTVKSLSTNNQNS